MSVHLMSNCFLYLSTRKVFILPSMSDYILLAVWPTDQRKISFKSLPQILSGPGDLFGSMAFNSLSTTDGVNWKVW